MNNITPISGIHIYPNPTHGDFTIDFNSDAERDVDMQLLDIVGQPVYSHTFVVHAGDNKEQIGPGTDVTSGIYIVKLMMNGQSGYYRIVIEK